MIYSLPKIFRDQHWHNTFQQPLLTIYQLAHAIFQIDLATATGRWGSALVYFMIACLAISYGCKKKFPLHYLTYPLASLLLTVSISNPMSAMRFFLVLFPIMIVGAHFFLSHKRTGAIYFYLLMLIQPLFWYLFVFYNGFIICWKIGKPHQPPPTCYCCCQTLPFTQY